MTTILAAFSLSLIFSLILTPIAGRLGIRIGAVDMPGERKVHHRPLPRTGGIAMLSAIVASLAALQLWPTDVSRQLFIDPRFLSVVGGALIVFGIGFLDDIRQIGAKTKLFFQIVSASLAWAGGIRIGLFFLAPDSIPFPAYHLLSYGITVFWFVLFINAMNLIDGLDGLAGGVAFFACIVMVIVLIVNNQPKKAMVFAALAGAILGFLRYNFNPASIFMGDGGSYLLGYSLAGLGIWSSEKSALSTALLIPLVALGVPVFDTLLSPLRRFIMGRKMFDPDRSHIHHRLVALGFSTKKVVFLIYGITICLCALGLLIVNVRDERVGLLLILLGGFAIIFVRKLGYFDYFAADKIYGWFKDITDVAGLTHERRSFLSVQVDVANSGSFEELWNHTSRALAMLDFDYGAIYLNDLAGCVRKAGRNPSGKKVGESPQRSEGGPCTLEGNERGERREVSAVEASVVGRADAPFYTWKQERFDPQSIELGRSLLRIELPLVARDGRANFGVLLLLKDMRQNGLSHYTLRRVEHLRRTIIGTMEKPKHKSCEWWGMSKGEG